MEKRLILLCRRIPVCIPMKLGDILQCRKETIVKLLMYSRMDDCTWYVDGRGDLRCDAVHHDGTNHYLYRVYKDGASEAQISRLKEKLSTETATRADVTRVTKRLGDEIGRVYGWRFPSIREAAKER